MKGPLMLVTPAPMPHDYTELGEAIEWEMIASIVNSLGLKEDDYSFASIVRCLPKRKGAITRTAIKMCSPFLFKEMNNFDRGELILFGAETLHALVNPGISMVHAAGLEHDTPFGKALVTYSIREYFRSIKGGGNNENVLNVGIIEVITAHIERFLYSREKIEFPMVEVVA